MGLFDPLRNALSPDYDAAVEYRCPSCERAFAYSATITDPSCPYCDAEDLDEVG